MNLVVDYFLIPLSPVAAFIFAGILLIGIQCIKSPLLRPLSKLVGVLGPIVSIFATWFLFRSANFVAFSNLGSGSYAPWLSEFIQSYQLDSITLLWYWAIGAISFLSFVFLTFCKL